MGADVIAEYLDVLRVRLGSRRDVEDLIAEAEDHLRAHVDALVRSGCDATEAMTLALRSFGDPNVVARSYFTTRTGRLAVPTEGTRAAGSFAVVGAALWVVFLVVRLSGHLLEQTFEGPVADYVFYFAGVFVLAGASFLTCAVAFGIRDRHGRAFGPVGAIGVGALMIGAMSTLVIGWAVPVWMTLLGVGTACVAVSMLRRPVAPRLPAILLALALPSGVATLVVARALELGRPDEFGEYQVATIAGLAVGCVLIGFALLTISRWLAREQPFVDIPSGATPMP